jgi:hypothetical protein
MKRRKSQRSSATSTAGHHEVYVVRATRRSTSFARYAGLGNPDRDPAAAGEVFKARAPAAACARELPGDSTASGVDLGHSRAHAGLGLSRGAPQGDRARRSVPARWQARDDRTGLCAATTTPPGGS